MKTQSEKLKELFPEPGMTAEEKERLRWKRLEVRTGVKFTEKEKQKT